MLNNVKKLSAALALSAVAATSAFAQTAAAPADAMAAPPAAMAPAMKDGMGKPGHGMKKDGMKMKKHHKMGGKRMMKGKDGQGMHKGQDMTRAQKTAKELADPNKQGRN